MSTEHGSHRSLIPAWSTRDLAVRIDPGLRIRPANRALLAQRSFLHDILIADSVREVGATIITENIADFTLIGCHVDIVFVPPWPTPAA